MHLRSFAVLLSALGLLASASAASAHGLIGQRFFPATLAIDDPFVADELSLPTIFHIRNRGSEEAPPTLQTDLSGELSKRLSPNLGVSLGGTYTLLDPIPGKSTSGFDNMEVSLEYVFWQSPAHETLLSFGRYFADGIAAVSPVHAMSGRSLGVPAEIQFYPADSAPKVFTWTPFHAGLGPAQPR